MKGQDFRMGKRLRWVPTKVGGIFQKAYALFCAKRALVVMFAASLLSSAINYYFQIYLGNHLSKGEYGIFNSQVAIMSSVGVIYLPITVFLCRMTAEVRDNIRSNRLIYRQMTGIMLLLSVMAMAFVLFFERAGIDDSVASINWMGIVLVMGAVVAAGFHNVTNSVLQGVGKYAWYGIAGLFLMVPKLLFVMVMPKNVNYALAGVVFGESFVTFVILLSIMAIYYSQEEGEGDVRKGIKGKVILELYGTTFVIQTLNSLYMNGGELILMRHVYDNEQIGAYSAAAMLAKIGSYVTGIVATVMLPEIALRVAKKDATIRRTLLKAFGLTAVLAGGYCVGLALFGKRVMLLLYGASYEDAGDLLMYFLPFTFGIAFLPVIQNVFLGMNRLALLGALYIAGVVLSVVTLLGTGMPMQNFVAMLGAIVVGICGIGTMYLWRIS